MSVNINNNNNSFFESKEFKLIFNLLEKAEQILSIINLSDSSISKYNTLKKLTFEMLKLEFKPLEKKYISPSNLSNQNISTNNNKNINDESSYLLYFQNIKKSMLIDLILNFMINNNKVDSEQDLNYYLNSLTNIYNLSTDIVTSKSINDISYEAQLEDSKFPSLFTKIDQIFVSSFDILKKLKSNYDNKTLEIKESFNQNLNTKNNIGQNPKNENYNIYYLDKLSHLIDESYEKSKQYSKINNKNISFKDDKLGENNLKLEFVKEVFDDYFKKNSFNFINNDINDILNLNQEKINLIEKNRNDNNNNYNNDLIREIYSSLPEIQKDNDIFHQNFNDLINYIEENIEGKVI
jgi:hypothetical protein